jgi:hypothetical protein
VVSADKTTNEKELMVAMVPESRDLEAKSAVNAELGESIPPVLVPDATSDGDVLAVAPSEKSSKHKASFARRLYEWKPRPARYDSENPPKFTLFLNILFAFVSSLRNSCPARSSDSFYRQPPSQ